jgi:predicted transcriptional regulator with HTH domain
MGLQVQPRDVLGALNGLGALQNPRGTALTFLGLSESEQQAGVPAWAWCVVVLGVGVYVGVKIAPRLK